MKSKQANTKFKWVRRVFDDQSAEWIELSIPSINWTYAVEQEHETELYECFLLFGKMSEYTQEIRLSKAKFKTQEQAKNFCIKHLLSTAQKLQKYLL
jgi:hypothetical protein